MDSAESKLKEPEQNPVSIVELYTRIKEGGESQDVTVDALVEKEAVRFDRSFSKLDVDRNGYLSSKELLASLDDRTTDSDVVHFGMSTRLKFASLKKLHPDADQDKGVSTADLAHYVNLLRQLRQVEKTGFPQKLFDEVDADKKYGWSQTEIQAAINDPTTAPRNLYLLKDVRTNFDRIAQIDGGKKTDPVTFPKIASFYKEEYHLTLAFENGLVDDFLQGGQPVRDNNGKKIPLYAQTENPETSIVPELCLQPDTGNGNCQFVASLQSLAYVNKQAIASMIRDNGNDTYTVTFPSAPKNPVTVSAPTDWDCMPHSPTAVWPYVLGKAYGRLCDPTALDDYRGAVNATTNARALRALIPSDRCAIQQLPGKSYKDMSTKLEQALSAGLPVFAGTGQKTDSGRPTGHELVDGHAYAVLAIAANEDEPKLGVVTLQSTHGPLRKDTGLDDLGGGKFNVTLQDFNSDFSRFVYGEPTRYRSTIYNWTDNLAVRDPLTENYVLGVGSGFSAIAAAKYRRTGGAVLGVWAASEMIQDAYASYNAPDSANRNKYAMGAAADAVMLAGFASRVTGYSKGYGLVAAGAGFVSRWAIEKWM